MEIPCKFEVLDWCRSPDTIAVYTCVVEKVSITERFLQIKDFKGIHQSGKSNVDVKHILKHHCTFYSKRHGKDFSIDAVFGHQQLRIEGFTPKGSFQTEEFEELCGHIKPRYCNSRQSLREHAKPKVYFF